MMDALFLIWTAGFFLTWSALGLIGEKTKPKMTGLVAFAGGLVWPYLIAVMLLKKLLLSLM